MHLYTYIIKLFYKMQHELILLTFVVFFFLQIDESLFRQTFTYAFGLTFTNFAKLLLIERSMHYTVYD